MSAILEIDGEVAHDLVHDHLDTILALLDRPLARDEVLARVGSKQALDRLVRYGLIAEQGTDLRAKASVYHELRQEGMMSFLEHYVLPGLTRKDSGNDVSSLCTRYLTIDDATARRMRTGRVQNLFNELTAVSDEPTDSVKTRLTVMVIGTSRVVREELDDESQALCHLHEAAIQRATPAEKDLAVLSQYVFLADKSRFATASAVVHEFVQSHFRGA